MARELREPLEVWFQAKVRKLNDRIEELAIDVAGEGQKFVWDAIEARGTGKTWKRTYTKRGISRSGSTDGRVWTGDMQEDVEIEVKRDPNAITASFGWIKNYQDYYGQQEGGFEHPTAGHVKGMFAMADAKDYIMKYANDKMKVVLREF